MNPLHRFYLGGTDDKGRTLEFIHSQTYGWLENTHDYIQWLFPTLQASQYNPSAPVLDPETLSYFRLPIIQSRIRESLHIMLGFYGPQMGFHSVFSSDGSLEKIVVEDLSQTGRRPRLLDRVTQDSCDHNYLRITRILQCLQLVGLHQEAKLFFQALENLYQQGKIPTKSFDFWKEAMLLERDLESVNDDLHTLEQQHQELSNSLAEITSKLKILGDSILEKKLLKHFGSEITVQKIMTWAPWWAITDSCPGQWHKKLTKWLENNYLHKGVVYSGYRPDTEQVAVRIRLNQNISLESQLGILDFIPHIKVDSNGCRTIGVSEQSLSGGVELQIHPSDKVDLLVNRRTITFFDNINEALDLVYKSFPRTRKQ